jgi:hypothetical protein
MLYQRPWPVSSIAHIHQLLPKVEGIVLSTTVHIMLTASSGVAAKLRTGSQPIPSKLTDKKKNRQHQAILLVYTSITLDHLAGVEYTSYMMVPSAISK